MAASVKDLAKSFRDDSEHYKVVLDKNIKTFCFAILKVRMDYSFTTILLYDTF